MAVMGVDISEMNGSVDFAALKEAGVQFVIIRCGYGSDFSHQDDTRFYENVRKAEATGMPWGVYLYSYALDAEMAKSEARHTLRLLDGRKPPYGVWYDVEDPQQAGCDLLAICQAYCQAIEAQGLYVGIYSMLSWWQSKLNDARLGRYDRWVAQWAGSCSYGGEYGMWQFTNCLRVGGKEFDGNWAYKDFPSLTGGKPEKEEGMRYKEFLEHMQRYEQERAALAVSGWAEPAVERVQELGAMQGDARGFRGQSYVTRQELAQVVVNLQK